jgi:hypothetical protein
LGRRFFFGVSFCHRFAIAGSFAYIHARCFWLLKGIISPSWMLVRFEPAECLVPIASQNLLVTRSWGWTPIAVGAMGVQRMVGLRSVTILLALTYPSLANVVAQAGVSACLGGRVMRQELVSYFLPIMPLGCFPPGCIIPHSGHFAILGFF